MVKHRGGPNHTYVEKCGDELWIAEKFQSNSEIAGSPRNSFRASLDLDYWGESTEWARGPQSLLNPIKLRIPIN